VNRLRRRRDDQRGQSLVEFSLIVTVILLLLSGTLEFGLLFDQHMTLETATREGARVGSALTNGGGDLGCGTNQSPDAATVDPQIIAAIQRVLASPGSRVKPSEVTEIKIYKVKLGTSGSPDTSGDQNGSGNTNASIWEYSVGNGPTVDGAPLNFRMKPGTVDGWPACSRSNGTPTDSIGISLTYTYEMVTPLPSVLAFFGGGPLTLTISDRTVMAMNPS
jgi:hypothetical protein